MAPGAPPDGAVPGAPPPGSAGSPPGRPPAAPCACCMRPIACGIVIGNLHRIDGLVTGCESIESPIDLDTEPIVRATSLAAHGSLAPVAGGPARTAMAAPGTAAAINPAKSLRCLFAVPV